MNGHWDRLNTWHLELSILADAVAHVLGEIEEPEGLSATAHVLKNRLHELVNICPFPERTPATAGELTGAAGNALRPFVDLDFDPDDFDGSLPADTAGVPAELLEGVADA